MSIKTGKKAGITVHKDQLMPEDGFIGYCNEGYVGNDQRLHINKGFLEAVYWQAFLLQIRELHYS